MTNIVQMSKGGTKFYPQTHVQAVVGLPDFSSFEKASDVQTAITNAISPLQTQVNNSAVGTNLLINTSSSSADRRTVLQGNSAYIMGSYSRTDSYEQVTAPSTSEFYYRFAWTEPNGLNGLTSGETYTISGSGSHTSGELTFRLGCSTDGKSWNAQDSPSDLGIPVSDGSVLTPFSYTFTIPTGTTGAFLGLQNDDYTVGSLFRFKNMKLEKGSKATDWCPNPSEIATNDGVQAAISGFQKASDVQTAITTALSKVNVSQTMNDSTRKKLQNMNKEMGS